MPQLAKNLRRSFLAGERDQKAGKENKFWGNLQESLEKKHLRPEEFSIAELFEEFVPDGRELRNSFNPRYGGSNVALLEGAGGGGAVNTGAFANITGQIVYSRIMDSYNAPGFIGDQLVETISTNFDGEKIPGIGQIGDEAEAIGEGNPYPLAGFSEEWIETPQTIKRGFIVGVTKEAVFFDRTGLILQRAGDVANWVRVNKEKRILDLVLGITTTYRRNGGTAQPTYGDTPFDNLCATNALVDWTDVENSLLLFDALADPNTGEPITIMPDTLVVPTALLMTARRILNASQIMFGPGGATAAAGSTVAVSGNPLAGMPFNIVSSQYVSLRASSSTTWWIGQFKKGFKYMENWPIAVQKAPANNEAEFTQDIVARWKVSERGAAAVFDPRYAVKNTA